MILNITKLSFSVEFPRVNDDKISYDNRLEEHGNFLFKYHLKYYVVV